MNNKKCVYPVGRNVKWVKGQFVPVSLASLAFAASVPAYAAIGFSSASLEVAETAGSATLTLLRTGSAQEAATVRVLVTHGTASEGEDFGSAQQSVSWAAGETGSRSITIPVFADIQAEGSETVYFAITDVQGDALGADTLQLVITDAGGSVGGDGGLTLEQRDAGQVLDELCTGSGSDAGTPDPVAETCRQFQDLSNAEQQDTVESLLPRHVTQQSGVSQNAQMGTGRALQQRMQVVRNGGGSGVAGVFSGFNLMVNGESVSLQSLVADSGDGVESGALADGGLLDERWGVFVSGQIQRSDQDSTDYELGFVADSQQVTAGADYRFSPVLFGGAALTLTSNDADSNDNGGKQKSDITLISVFGNYYLGENLYLDGWLSHGQSSYDTERMIRFGSGRSKLLSDTDGTQSGIALTLGYDKSVNAWQFGGYGRAESARYEIDAYSERGESGFGLGIEAQKTTSAQTALGGSVSYVYPVNYGIWIPKLNAEWVHEFQSDSRGIQAYFASNPDAGWFSIETREPDRDYFNVGWSVSGTFAQARSVFLRYEAQLGRDDYIAELIEVGGRVAF